MHSDHSPHTNASDLEQQSAPLLIAVTWTLSSLLIILIVILLLCRLKSPKSRQSHIHDDVLIALVCLFAVAGILLVPSTATPAAARSTSVTTAQASRAMVKSYTSMIVFTVALGLSKVPIILWLRRLRLARLYMVFTSMIGCAILAFAVASLISIIFQCEFPRPWNIQSGRCLSTQSFWTSTVAIEITFDMLLIIIPVLAVTSLCMQLGNERWVLPVLFFRTLLIVISLLRLVYLQQSRQGHHLFALENLPYTIITQFQIAIAAILAFSPALPCLASLINASSGSPRVTHNKHWSGSSLGSDIATDYFASAPSTPAKESLSSMQASMASPTSYCHGSNHGSVSSLASLSRTRSTPMRPPPPSAEQRPDMRMFTRRPTVTIPPPVTLSRDSFITDLGNESAMGGCGVEEGARLSKHVKFVV